MSTDDLFADATPEAGLASVLAAQPWAGRVASMPGWLEAGDADALQATMAAEAPWTVHRIRMFGRWVDSPRQSCWMGDPGVRYRYSGAMFDPEPWQPAVRALLPRLEAACGARFNSVLINRYRNGLDSMGWHSDDEPELGPAPIIASVSLGVARRFLLRMKRDHEAKLELRLRHGDLLVMRSDCQRVAQHALPKMAAVRGERINLTFRWVNPR